MLKKLLTTLLSTSMLIQGIGLPVLANEFDFVEEMETTSTQEIYRFYNRQTGEHFYTGDANEKDALVKGGWRYEGIGWYSPSSSNTPVYRFYNKNSQDHHYTTNGIERDALIRAGWKDEGISWYSDDAQRVPLYRQYNPNARTGNHNYTTDKSENDQLCRMGWKAEGIGWYGIKKGEPAPAESVNYEALYRPILNEVQKIIKNKGKGNYRQEFEGIVDAVAYGHSYKLGYTIQDLSGDGIPELVLGLKNEEILAVYTLVNNSPFYTFSGRLVGTRYYYGGGSNFIVENGTGVMYSGGIGLFSLSHNGQSIIYSEYYYSEPNSSFSDANIYLLPEPVYGPDIKSKGKYIGGLNVYRPKAEQILAKKQNLNLTLLNQ